VTTREPSGNSGADPGANPLGSLTLDNANGDIFGSTAFGGSGGVGTVYQLSGGAHTTFTSLLSFPQPTNANFDVYPAGDMVLDSSGNLFGVATDGGIYNDGSTDAGLLFEITAANRAALVTLYNFNNSTGAGYNPAGGLVIDAQGNLYGVANRGGANGDGTIFEYLKTIQNQMQTLYSFTGDSGGAPGAYPNGPLIIDSNGDLFGTTYEGGTSGDGTVFELPTAQLVRPFFSLVSFTGTAGKSPGSGTSGPLMLDSSGNLFGTNLNGGTNGDGTVFEIQSIASQLSLVFSSQPTNSSYTTAIDASGGVQVSVYDANGNLVTGSTDQVTLFLGENTSGAVLSGTLTEPVVSGVATFSNLSINLFGENNYTLVATDNSNTGVQSTTSVPFNVGFIGYLIGSGGIAHLPTSSPIASVWVANNITLFGNLNSWQSRLDLENNDFDVINGSLSTLTNQLSEGYSSGLWNGEGISSSTASNETAHLSALGIVQNNETGTPFFAPANLFDNTNPGASDILIKYTYYGDTNLDGKIDGTDYSRVDNGFLKKLTGWSNGDFNYDGVVDGSDYTLIDNAFNQQGASLAVQANTDASPATEIASSQKINTFVPPGFLPSQTQISFGAVPLQAGDILLLRPSRGDKLDALST
jgi:uncharacterized repeat protein (TIGR03803 family)